MAELVGHALSTRLIFNGGGRERAAGAARVATGAVAVHARQTEDGACPCLVAAAHVYRFARPGVYCNGRSTGARCGHLCGENALHLAGYLALPSVDSLAAFGAGIEGWAWVGRRRHSQPVACAGHLRRLSIWTTKLQTTRKAHVHYRYTCGCKHSFAMVHKRLAIPDDGQPKQLAP